MGAVYKARDRRLGRTVAIKLAHGVDPKLGCVPRLEDAGRVLRDVLAGTAPPSGLQALRQVERRAKMPRSAAGRCSGDGGPSGAVYAAQSRMGYDPADAPDVIREAATDILAIRQSCT
jgi:hypothetical protein